MQQSVSAHLTPRPIEDLFSRSYPPIDRSYKMFGVTVAQKQIVKFKKGGLSLYHNLFSPVYMIIYLTPLACYSAFMKGVYI